MDPEQVPAIPVYAIDGNHEDFRLLKEATKFGEELACVTEVAPNRFYVPRGTVLELDGKRIAFMGGAASVDKAFRLKNGWHWFEDENITPADVARLERNLNDDYRVDLLITHAPPQWLVQKHFDPNDLVRYFDLPNTWRDPNMDVVEALAEWLGDPPHYCGHMHRSVVSGNTRILNIDEAVFVP
jgi:hypothetical protein